MMPSAAELTYFLEAANTLNLSIAAKNLGMTQPALSRAIQNLEMTTGAALLIRHQRGVTLTPAGKKMLQQVKPLLQHWQNTKLEALAAHQEVQGKIKIGCHSTTAIFLHGILCELLEQYTGLEIELCHGYSENLTQQVIDLNLDIGIVTNPIQYPDLIIRKITETDTTLWVGKGNREIQKIHSPDSILICNPAVRHTQIMLQQCKTRKINFRRLLKVNSIEVVASLTANGCGIGLLPSSFVQAIYGSKLKRIANMPVIKDDLNLIYRKEYINVKAVQIILAAIRERV